MGNALDDVQLNLKNKRKAQHIEFCLIENNENTVKWFIFLGIHCIFVFIS
jgi:hypothetical protein